MQTMKPYRYPSTKDTLSLLGVFILMTLIATIVGVLLQTTNSTSHGFAIFITYIIQFTGSIAYALYQKRKAVGSTEQLLKFKFRWSDPLVTVWGVILVTAIGIVVEPLINMFPETYFDALNQLMGAGGWMLITAVVAAPILEEVFFRGIIQQALTDKYSPLVGIVAASVIFGAVHINPPQALNAFFLALAIGFIYYMSGSLLPVIFIHVVNNALSYLMWSINGEKTVTLREFINNDSIFKIVYAVSSVLIVLAIINVVIKLRQDEAKRKLKAQEQKNISQSEVVDNNIEA